MDLFNLVAKLGLDTSEYDSKLGSVMDGIGKIGKAISGALTVATGAVMTFAGSSIKTGMEFDKAMSQVQATMLKTAEEMKNDIGSVDTAYGHFEGNLRDFAKFLGENTAFSATQAAEALNYMALAGYETQDSLNMLPHVMSLASAGGIDLARASDMVTDAQTALGLTFDQTGDMVNQMAMAASKSNTSVEQLGDAILTLGGTARYMYSDMENGIPVTNELTKVLGVLADNGIKGSEAGTHLRNMLLKLSAPTADATALLDKYAQVLGHDLVFDEKTGEMRQFQDIFQDLNLVMGDLTDEQKLQAFSELFNTRDIAAANALLNTTGKHWKQLGESIDNASGSAAEMAGIQLDNLNGALTLLRSAFEGLQINVSEKLTPTLVEFVQFGTQAISTLSSAFSEGDLEGAMDALGGILSDGLNMVIERLPMFVEAGMGLLTSLADGIISNLPVILTAGSQIISSLITSLGVAIPQLIFAGFETLTTFLKGIVQNIPAILSSAKHIISSLAGGILSNLNDIIEAGIEILDGFIEGIMDNLPTIITTATTVIFALLDALIDHLDEILDAGVEILFALIDGIIEAIPRLIPAIVKIIMQIVTKLTDPDMVMKMIQAAFKIMVAIADGLIDALPEIIRAVPKIILQIVMGLAEALPQLLASGVQMMIQLALGIVRGMVQVTGAVADVIKNIGSDFRSIGSQAIQWGKDLISNFVSGIKNSISKVVNAAKNVASKVKSILGFSEPEDGPLSNFHTYAPDMMALFAEGIKKNTHLITDQLEKSFDFGDMLIPTIPTTPIADEVQGVGGTFAPTINVYAAEGQNVREIAEEVMDIMTAQYDRRKAVYA